MADRVIKHFPLAPGDLPVKFKDLGDGTYALYLALEPASIGGGGAGGGAATIADGADVAQGAKADVAWVSGDGTVISLLKKIASSGAAAGLTDTQLRASAVPVSGAFFQATQPVSLAVAPTTPVTGTFWQATQPVSGTFWQATQPISGTVSLAANTPDVTDRAARLLGHVTVDNASIPVTGTFWQATQPVSGTFWQATQPVSGPLTDTQLRASAVPVSGPLTDTQLRASAVPVSGSFFQVTQPVSLATNTPDVTDRAARLLGHVTVDTAPTTAVTGTFWQATQPVSLATNTPDVTDRAARLLGIIDKGKVWDGTNTAAVKAASVLAAATDPAFVVTNTPQRADAANLCVTNTAATGVACTLTLPAPAAGLFHYISLIEIQLYATAARTGGATPVLVTTTNLPGSPVWDFDTAQAVGATIRQTTQPATPIKSSVANTATTIVAPIATTGIWRITAYYYTAP